MKPWDGCPPVGREAIERYAAAALDEGKVTNFRVEITKKGVDLFYKENYPSMVLVEDDGRFLSRAITRPMRRDPLTDISSISERVF